MWSLAGLALASFVSIAAFLSASRHGGYYAREVYAMTPRLHRRYAIVSLVFVLYFASALWWWRNAAAGIAGLAVYAVIAILYGTSFLRGASDDE